MLPRDKADFPKMLGGIRKLVRRGAAAESVVAAIANRFAQIRFPILPTMSGATKALTTKPAVVAFAAWLSNMNLKDAGFWLSSAYAQLLKAKKRRKRAMFFTPPILGDRILDDMEAAGVRWDTAKVIDLACGGAAFLAPAARRMADALALRGVDAKRILAHIETHLVGIEIEPFLAKLSRFFVSVNLYRWIEAAGYSPTIAVSLGDAMKRGATLAEKYDAVICNPPYRKLTVREVAALPANLRTLCFMQPNLYGMFMARAVQLLNERGVAGLLTPMSFLSGQSFLRLRKHLAAERYIAHIDLVEEKDGVFLGVEQSTAISIYAPKMDNAPKTTAFIGTASAGWKKTGAVALDPSGGPWILPRSSQDAALLATANGRTIADYGYSATVGHLVLHRDPRRRFSSLSAARRAKAVKPVPMLRASEIRTSGQLRFKRSQRPDSYVDVGRSPRGLISSPAIALQRVTSSDQDRRLISAPVPRKMQKQYGGVLGENHVNFLVVHNGSAVSRRLVTRILASGPVDRLFRCRSGANNVSVYELAHLPLPDPAVVRSELAAGVNIDAAVRAGYGIPSKLGNTRKKHASRSQIRRATERS